MKKEIRILACVAILGFAILPGCNKNNINLGGDKAVRFSATSGPVDTKTAYGPYNTADPLNATWQRIDWVVGDKIRLYSDRAEDRYTGKTYSDYKITSFSVENNNRRCWAKLINAGIVYNEDGIDPGVPEPYNVDDVNGLLWGEEETYKFWGIYPATDEDSDYTITIGKDDEGNHGYVEATLPWEPTLPTQTEMKYLTETGAATTQNANDIAYTYTVYKPDMSYAFMTAANTNVPNGTDFDLEFYPAFTAFEINLTTKEDTFTVTSIGLEAEADDEYLAGGFSMMAGDTGYTSVKPTAGEAKKSVSVAMNKEIDPDNGVTVTLFTIPKTNTGMIKLVIETSEGPATLAFTKKNTTDEPYQFEAGKKYRINLLQVGGRWKDLDLVFEVQDWVSVPENVNTSTGSINMSGVSWMNRKVTVGSDEKNTVDIGDRSVTLYYVNDSYTPAMGFFTVTYPVGGKFKIGLIPAHTDKDPDGSKFKEDAYEIKIYQPKDGDTPATWRAQSSGGEPVTEEMVYFQVQASGIDVSEHMAQIDIWFQLPGSSEWISAYSEIRANYALIIPARNN